MWTLIILLKLWCLRLTVSASPPSPINVGFSSVNLRNVLHWVPGNGTSEDNHFTVEYAIYGDTIEGNKGRRVHWRLVRHCTEIVRTWCDLSNETWDEEQGYYARVRTMGRRASSKWALTRRRFDPKSDTTFGPPLVSVEIENNSAIITLKGPMRYSPNNHTPVVSMAAVYPEMTYNLSIHNTRRNHMQHFPGVTSPYRYGLMEYNTEYCFSAQSKFFYMPAHCQSSTWYCITTPQDPVIVQLQRVIVGVVVPSLFLCMITLAGYLLYNYLSGKGQKSPYILNPPSFHPPPVMLPPENLNIVLISVLTDEPPLDTSSIISDHICPRDTLHSPDPPPSYFPQGSETPLENEEAVDEGSIDYGSIIGGREEATEMKYDGGNNLKCEGTKEERCRLLYDPRVTSGFSQRSEMCGHGQEHVSTLPAQFQSLEGLTMGKINESNENRELPDVFVSKNSQTSLFHVPVSVSEEEIDGRIRDRKEKIDGDVEERAEPEKAPLLSGYASQNMSNMATSSQSGHSDPLPDDYGVLKTDGDNYDDNDDEEEEEEEGALCIDWAHESRKLILPVKMGLNKDRGLDEAEEVTTERHDEETLSLFENVFVRQESEEEAQRQLEDIVTKWNLVFSMDQ